MKKRYMKSPSEIVIAYGLGSHFPQNCFAKKQKIVDKTIKNTEFTKYEHRSK
jgi:hypothetical protein